MNSLSQAPKALRHCASRRMELMSVLLTSRWCSSPLRTTVQIFSIGLASSCFSLWSRVYTTREQYRRRPPRWFSINTCHPMSVLEARQHMQRQEIQLLIKHSKTMAGSSQTWPALSLMEIAFTTLRAHSSLNHRTRKSCSRLTPGIRWKTSSWTWDFMFMRSLSITMGIALTYQIRRCQFLSSRLTTWFTAFRGQPTQHTMSITGFASQESNSTRNQMRQRRPSWVPTSSPTSSPRSTSPTLLWHLRRTWILSVPEQWWRKHRQRQYQFHKS